MLISAGYTHIEHECINSTNLEAKRLVKSRSFSGDFIVSAKTQSAGRGRLNRNWVSNEGNLFVSIAKIIEPKKDDNTSKSLLPFIAALAVGCSVKEFINNEKPSYKWPNDVLIGGKKIAGILIETINNYEIIGIGVNIANCPESNTNLPATYLNCYAEKFPSVSQVLESLVYNLDLKIDLDRKQIVQEWMEGAYGINQNITIHQENKEISGAYKGVDENGWLILEAKQGKREVVLFGDVSWNYG